MITKNVLVVDDLPDWRKTLSGIFSRLGYKVYIASNSVEAIQIVEQEPIHLIVLDVRLNEQDEDSREGLALMNQIKAFDPNILIIILTGYADVKMVKEARNPREDGIVPAYAFIEKEDSNTLADRVDKAFAEGIKINWDLNIQNFTDYQTTFPKKIKFTLSEKPSTELLIRETDELFRRLFLDCNKIVIQKLNQGFGGTAVFAIEPVYKGRGPGEPVIVKIGEYAVIQEENNNYQNWVAGVVGGHRQPKQLELKRTRNLGGLIYSFAGLGQIEDFATFYQDAPLEKVSSLLENLFLETCFPLSRENAVHYPSFNLTDYYLERFKLKETVLKEAIAALVKPKYNLSWFSESDIALIFAENVILPNPVNFALNNSIITDIFLVTVHGDLTPYNIIVDHHHEAWLIDFATTGPGPLLTDFARLEAFMKFLLLSHYDPHILFLIEAELANSADMINYQFPRDQFNNEELYKLYSAVAKIRHLAFQVARGNALVQYFTALLFSTLKITTVLQKIPSAQRLSAALSAALICKRLKELNGESV